MRLQISVDTIVDWEMRGLWKLLPSGELTFLPLVPLRDDEDNVFPHLQREEGAAALWHWLCSNANDIYTPYRATQQAKAKTEDAKNRLLGI